MIDTSPRLILKAPRASALCPLSSPVSSTIFLFVYDFGLLEVLLVLVSRAVTNKKRNHQINASTLLSYLAFSLCLFHPLPCLFSHSFSFQNVVNMCRHWLQTKHQSLKSVAWCQLADEHSRLTKPHRPPSSILIGSLFPPPQPETCEGKSTLGWMFEVKENLKNERDYKQTNMPLAVIPDWTLFSCQCFLFNVYTVCRHSYNLHH